MNEECKCPLCNFDVTDPLFLEMMANVDDSDLDAFDDDDVEPSSLP